MSQELKYIHQLWVFQLTIDALGLRNIVPERLFPSPITYVAIEQGRGRPSIVFEDRAGNTWSGWVECQVLKEVEDTWFRMLTKEGEQIVKRAVWARADIVFAKGDWRGREEQYGGMYWTVRDLKADLLIECKHEEVYEWWSEKTRDQLRQYVEVFRPTHALLVSLRKIPSNVREAIEALGYKVFDEVYPNSSKTNELIRYLERLT